MRTGPDAPTEVDIVEPPSLALDLAADGLLDIVRSPSCDSATLCEVERVLDEYITLHRPCARAIELDRQMALHITDEVFLAKPEHYASLAVAPSELADAIRKGDLETRKQWREEARTLLDDWYARARAASAPGNHADFALLAEEARKARESPADPAEEWFGTIATDFAPIARVLSRCEAVVQGMRILAAVALYRADTKKPPAALADLVPNYLPSVPNDPFDGKPIRYAADGEGCRAWSIGADLLDGGGEKADDQGMVEPGTDVIWEMK